MNGSLYFRLARNNLVKNRRTYVPFLLASSLLAFAQYSFYSMTFNPGLNEVHGGSSFVAILYFGIVVIGLFTGIFLFYANSFLIKRRKKELGLYSILGMEKKHVGRVIRNELRIIWFLSMAIGLGLGVVLARLLFLCVRLIIRVDVPLVGSVSLPALGLTVALFAILFLLLDLYNTLQVRTISPIALLRGEQTGEREPKARWFLAIVGAAMLLSGYFLAQNVHDPMTAIALFFIAVLLVIVGTYLLFLTGSIAICKLLKRNPRIYYRSDAFITISSMLYRMKQNAAGLASIAILCTMAMITIGTTVALYNGSEQMLDEYYPYDYQVSFADAQAQADAQARIEEFAANAGATVRESHSFKAYELSATYSDARLLSRDGMDASGITGYEGFKDILLMTESQFDPLERVFLNLSEDELGWYSDNEPAPASVTIGDARYRVRAVAAPSVRPCMRYGSFLGRVYLIAPNEKAAQAVCAALGAASAEPVYTTQWNLADAAKPQYQSFTEEIDKGAPEWYSHYLRDKTSLREEWYAMHGGFLFVGIFLGAIFLMGTALVIYFKQISEGYQDHDRYIILQKVGMSEAEVRRTVNRQILIVFFLPLLVAICHVIGSLNMIILMLKLFGLMDAPYIMFNSLGAALGVAALYMLFYWRTAKSYYKIVRI